MAVQALTAQIRLANSSDGGSYWDLTATAATQDTAAGSSVNVTCTVSTATATLAPPTAPTNADVYFMIDNSATQVKTIALSASAGSSSQTFFFTDTGLTGGASRAGMIRIKVRLRQTGGLAATQYDVSSEPSSYGSPANSLATGSIVTAANVGYIRGTTTASTVLAGSGTLAYNTTLTATTTLGAAPFSSRTLNVALSPITATASAASTTTTFTTALGVVDNRFPASSASRTTAVTFPNAGLVGIAWTTATLTETTRTIDPRITFTQILQNDSSTFATPPTSSTLINTAFQRLNAQLGFLASRATDANGNGVTTLTWTDKLWDNVNLVSSEASPAKTRTATASTQGGQTGWTDAFLTWDNSLPGGTWTYKQVITAPANAVGLEASNVTSVYLLAVNPLYRIVTGLGPSTTAVDGDHWHPGESLTVGMAMYDIANRNLIAPDASPVPRLILGRFNLTYGRAEYLTSTTDGSGSLTWAALTGATAYEWVTAASAGDANTFVKTFTATETANWGTADLFVIGIAYINGTPYNDFSFRDVLSKTANPHSKYKFDATGLFK